ncbi:CDP-glycerol:poly(glycerophosphate) glycerophosphotransferase [Megamonas hypermegale]|uniref:CDP-glycerol:poly(Glycerophosphate) glycerophosphotransferase n=1 Tax=Megamonas hypermegale TaxID=158847 RepID=A0A378NW17_9FIRM|nr:CDP-glycerol glycerophosphotransferase family protein [Megamonas hypermegale]STY72097.1 CDP-glycerol:poly(glycerophosphate) glycerophosphotransferase [Megamonas hypermegale]
MEFIKYIIIFILRYIISSLCIFPIDNRKIVFYPINGNYYCNLKYISEYIENNFNEKKIIWFLKDKKVFNNKKFFSYRKNSFSFFYHVMTARFIIFNDTFPKYFFKRKKQIYINTWHGGGAYKKIDSVYKNDLKYFRKKRMLEALNKIDYIIASSEGFKRAFAEDTGINVSKFLNIGMPRNDIFFSKEKIENISSKIYDIYNIDTRKKIVLYAPTFREHNLKDDLNIDRILETLNKRFNNQYIFMLRCHPHIMNKVLKKNKKSNNIIDVSLYPDMQELLCATDILITDYSSCMWDFSLMYKPCFIYANDLEEYKIERNFHTPIKDWPFPLSINNDELIKNIDNFDNDKYIKKVKEHHEKLGSYENGQASEKICILINCICSEES